MKVSLQDFLFLASASSKGDSKAVRSGRISYKQRVFFFQFQYKLDDILRVAAGTLSHIHIVIHKWNNFVYGVDI